MGVRVADVRALVDEAALGADSVLEIALPSFASAFRGDDLRRFVLWVEAEVGYGSETSTLRLVAEPVGGPVCDVVDLGQLLSKLNASRLPDEAAVVVRVDGEPDDRVDRDWNVVQMGAVRHFGDDRLPTLLLRLEAASPAAT